MTYLRERGHVFSKQEILDFWHDSDRQGGKEVVTVCDHVKPGVPLSLPFWSGYSIIRLKNGDVLERVPDNSRPDDFGQLFYRGSNIDGSALTDLIVDFIIGNNLSITVALAFCFTEAAFGDDGPVMESLRRRLWSEWNGVSESQKRVIDARLHDESPAYAIASKFLAQPNDPTYRGLRESAIKDSDLSHIMDIASE